jgi:F-type H+-transporting ATPase subunit epsilon
VARTFRCSIVTPTELVLDQDVTYASVPAWDGQIGFMPGGSPVLAKLGVGSLRLDFPEGGSRWYMLDGGVAQFQDNSLSLLSEAAVAAESISITEAQAELAEASARVVAAAPDRAKVERDQARAMTRVSLARAHESRGRAI